MSNLVLAVDDDLIAQEILKNMLEEDNYRVEFASNGTVALEKAALISPDIILLDVVMPGMSGFEV